MDVTMKNTSRGSNWVCPNDRHLALRAKLRTGWSVKTGSLDSTWGSCSNFYSSGTNRCAQSFALSEEEQQTIIQVIQRAEALDLSEQERIGRLVERLENMKRNVCMVTSTRLNERKSCSSRCSRNAHCICSCALCGEKFGTVLGATPSLCKDCRKYICQKCGIETNELNSTFSNISIMREKTEQVTAMQRILKRSGSSQKQFLCRICAETREMWKKSGAWFFKGMPKYILPEKKERGWSRSIHKTSTWISGGNKSLESAELQDSSSDEEATRRLALVRRQSSSFSSLQKNQDSITNKTHSSFSNSAQSTSSICKISSRQPSNDFSPLNNRDECSDQLDKSTLSIISQCSRLSPTTSVAGPRSRTNSKTNNDYQVEQRVSFEDEIMDEKNKKFNSISDSNDDNHKVEVSSHNQSKISKVESLRSNSSTIVVPMEQVAEQFQVHEKCINQEGCGTYPKQENLFNSIRSINQMNIPRLQRWECETKQNYGTLEVSLRYDPAVQCLQCKVERARGLRPMDIHGLADPFCKLNILPITAVMTTKRLRTKTVHKTRDPEFNEILNFYGTTETDIWNGKALHILILQDDPAGQDFLGEAKFPLHELQPRQTKHYNVPLQDHYSVDNEEAVWGVFPTGRGQIQLSLGYCTRRGALMVTVHRATNLLPMDSNGSSDPFVKLCLIENVTNNHQQRIFDYSFARIIIRKLVSKKATNCNSQNTSVKWKTLNPEWNEEFAFTARLTDLMKITLCLTVWDKDFGKSNDYLGGLELSCNSKGARLQHWIDAIKFPDHLHQAWHNLTDTILPTE